MASITVKTSAGGDAGSFDLPDAIFGIEPNVPVMHQVVTAQLAARRSGTQSTKTRAEVAGGGAKPWKQKGTGRARQGSIRSPQWKGGGVALGPKPRSYAQRTPKKMIRLALRSALSDRAADGKVIVLDAWGFDAPSTKAAVELLANIGTEGRVLAVIAGDDETTWKSFRNLQRVHLIEPGQLNAYDVLVSDYVVFVKDTVPTAEAEVTKPKTRTVALTSVRTATIVVREPAPGLTVSLPGVDGPDVHPAVEAADEEALGEADDMASDLPNRPKPDPSKASKPVEATERVKSAADKPDPRFEAARQKIEKEERLRAKAAKASAKAAGEAIDDADDEVEEPELPAKKTPFSFNQTTRKDES